MRRSTLLALAVVVVAVLVTVLVTGAVVVVRTVHGPGCGAAVTSVAADRSRSPFLDTAGRAGQPDRRRDRAVQALTHGRAPLGPVVGAVGYDYGQWAQLSAFARGLGVRTRDNPEFTLLDDSLRPRWSVRVDTARSAYDADASTYLVVTEPRDDAPTLVALDLRTGHRRWCTTLGGPAVRASDPFATLVDPSGTVSVLGPASHGRQRLVRLGHDGRVAWRRSLSAGAGDFLGALGHGLLVAGGSDLSELYDARALASRRAGTVLVAVSARTGRTVWHATAARGEDLHVLGGDGDGLVALRMSTGATAPELVGLDAEGRTAWHVVPAPGHLVDAAMVGGRVLVRDGSRWSSYDATTGRRLWVATYPDRPQLLPYGFDLDTLPLLDADTALLGTTTALRTIDLRSGRLRTLAALPRDGVSTTYWPYQVAVTDHLIGVATNTSAVVLRRR